ncbi:MAG: hypothetical protein J3R72DRAFT_520548 [Linnemannia gamsii]|nr:MAG: hypothetical protein J3R72DRAFT_520548 [Linnemannia gamsii]
MTSPNSPTSPTSPFSQQHQQQQLITVNVRASKDKTYPITVSATDTVLQLKERVALLSGATSDRIRLVHSGRVLKDAHSIESYKVVHGNVVHMVRSPVPPTTTTAAMIMASSAAAATAQGQTSILSNNSTFASPSSPFLPVQQQTGVFTSHTHAGFYPTTTTTTPAPEQTSRTHPASTGFGFGHSNNFNNNNSNNNGGHGLAEEAEMMMGQMMQDPTFAQFMSSMLQNPQILESMIATNPMLQAMLGGPGIDLGRRVLQSPQFQQMVASPDALRQVAQMGGDNVSRSTSSVPTTTTTTTAMNNSNYNSNTSAASYSPINTSASSPTPTASATTTTTTTTTVMPPSVPGGMRVLPSSLISAYAPEKRFQVQLQQLSEMGFWDPTKNMRALQVTGGDVNSAIEILCSGV